MSDGDLTLDRTENPTAEAERREAADRRVRSASGRGRRGVRSSRLSKWVGIAGRDMLMVAATLAAMILSIRYTKPIFANQPKVVESLTRNAPAALAPIAEAALEHRADTGVLGTLISSPEFERDRKAFAADLVATGRMSQERADSIAFYAVREAYVREIPPALIFGVMLTENARFVSKALSNVGAVGLMQVYPKVWLKPLSPKFGPDLASDSTNLKYGVYILAEYIKSKGPQVTTAELNKGLLRYNGCVRGTNTPHCKTYPSKVRKYVEREANMICGDRSFTECIAKPFVEGLLGKDESARAGPK
jgi:soluble lytic murein transglycosylase-like protein